MDLVEQSLHSRGVAPARIHIERFTPAEWMDEPELPAAVAPERDAVTVELDGRTSTADYRPGTTILQTARQMGLAPPFSCESGSCATCMAKLVEGTATMHVNNALTDDEVDARLDTYLSGCADKPVSARRLRVRGGVMAKPPIADVIELEQLLARYAVGMTRDDIDTVARRLHAGRHLQRLRRRLSHWPTSRPSWPPRPRACS